MSKRSGHHTGDFYGSVADRRLLYRRQFLLSKAPVVKLFHWKCIKLDQYYLYAHPDLDVTVKEDKAMLVVLIGYIFCPSDPAKKNQDIVSDIVSKADSLDAVIALMKPMAGRYAMIYRDKGDFVIFNDPLGLREIYYCTKANRIICGSQPNLINEFAKPRLGITDNRDILEFYEKDLKLVRSGRAWVGDETYFKNIKHLLPNHYLDIHSLKARRYWPNKRLEKIKFQTAVNLCCNHLRGVLKAVTTRYNVMMAVTAGHDSRSLLAASKEVHKRIYYFINKEPHLNDASPDIRVPQSMFARLNIPFHIHNVDGAVDQRFKEIFLNNTFMSTELILPTIYNVYYKYHGDKVNLLGVGEIGRDFYGRAPCNLDGYYLARCLKYKSSKYATEQCEKWLTSVREIAEKYNVDIMKLLLWEMLLGNWGCVGNSESDIAIEEFDPYDSHFIYEVMLSVDPTEGDLFRGMIMEMWPELLDFPINPSEKMGERLKELLQRIGILQHMRRLLYSFDRLRFCGWKLYR